MLVEREVYVSHVKRFFTLRINVDQLMFHDVNFMDLKFARGIRVSQLTLPRAFSRSVGPTQLFSFTIKHRGFHLAAY